MKFFHSTIIFHKYFCEFIEFDYFQIKIIIKQKKMYLKNFIKRLKHVLLRSRYKVQNEMHKKNFVKILQNEKLKLQSVHF
jgi:hypothetical protein